MRVVVSMLLILSSAVASIAWAVPPVNKTQNLKTPDVYQLDTADVVALSSSNPVTGSQDCLLYVVQMDGTLHFPFGKVKARGMTIAEVRDSLKPLSEAAQKDGMVDVVVTIVDMRNSANDQVR